MTYTPAIGDRILIHCTPSIHGGTGTITGTVLDILTIGEIDGILHFQDDAGPRVYMATNEQMAEVGVKQTIQPLPA